MGRGDIKTKKGKTKAGSFGKVRPAKVAKKGLTTKSADAGEKVVVAKAEKKVATKKAK